MKKGFRRVLIGFLILVVLGIIIIPRLDLFSKSSGAPAPVQQETEPLEVSVVVLSPGLLLDKVISSGTILPNEEVELSSENSGLITHIYFEEGSRVEKNDLLVKINDSELQAQLKRLEFQKTLAAEKEFRQKELLSRDAVSQEEYDQALTELNTLKADIDLAKAKIDKTEIRAPFAGTIGLRYVSEGSYITPSTKIARLISLTPVKIDFSVPEKYAREVKIGNTISFAIEGLDEKHEAKVYAIEPMIDANTRTIKLRAVYPNRDQKIMPGQFADVELVLHRIEDAVKIPTEALIPELGGQKVFINRNGKATPVKVETGIRTTDMVQITEGLKAGDTLVTSGILQMREGMPLNISELKKQ